MRAIQWIIFLISLAGAALLMFSASRYGLGVSPDSIGYFSVSENIVSGKGFLLYNNTPLVSHPPMYPIVLAVPQFLFKIDALQSSLWINAIIFSLVLYISGILFLKAVPPKLALLGVTLLLLPLLYVMFMAWSEPLFIFFSILSFYVWSRYVEQQRWSHIIYLSLLTAFAIMTRYIGVVIWLSIILSMLTRQHFLKRHAASLTIISLFPISIWSVRNYFYTETFFGPRTSSNLSLIDNISFVTHTIVNWFIPRSSIIQSMTGFLFAFYLTAITGLILKNLQNGISFTIKINHVKTNICTFPIFYCITYISFLILSSSMVAYDTIDSRLLSPVVIPFTLFFLIISDKLLRMKFISKIDQRIVSVSTMIVILLFTVFSIGRSLSFANRLFNQGLWYTSKDWIESETVSYVRTNQMENCTIYSNAPEVLYFLANKQSETILQDSSNLQFITSSLQRDICLVYFKDLHGVRETDLEVMMNRINFNNKFKLEFDDGLIYVLSSTKNRSTETPNNFSILILQ